MNNEHIVRSFDQELEQLKGLILQMGGLAENQLAAAIDAISKNDYEGLMEIAAKDSAIDKIEDEINALAIQMIAKRQPMATDLRMIVCSIKTAGDIERVGDYIRNICKRSQHVTDANNMIEARHTIARMAEAVMEMIRNILTAYTSLDVELAMDVWRRDASVDDMHSSLFRELLTYMMESPRTITECTHLLFIAKNIERMGDLVTNIAEHIYLIVNGVTLEAPRPKGENSADAGMVEPL
ncbi:MAG: phosphate signaling complex protein PhoU [Alphaproteobacteria bacterium]